MNNNGKGEKKKDKEEEEDGSRKNKTANDKDKVAQENEEEELKEEKEDVERMISATTIQQFGFAFEHTQLCELIRRCSRSSLSLAWRQIARMKDEEIQMRSKTDQSTYLHHIVNQVVTSVPPFNNYNSPCSLLCSMASVCFSVSSTFCYRPYVFVFDHVL